MHILDLRKHNALARGGVGCEDRAVVQRDASEAAVAHGHRKLAARAEDDDAPVARVSDDELVEGRARDALWKPKHGVTHTRDDAGSNQSSSAKSQ
jgi:hypothetical protein